MGSHVVVSLFFTCPWHVHLCRVQEDESEYDASFRTAWDCCPGGFAVGSQPQEAWHRWKLKGGVTGVKDLKMRPDALFSALEEFLVDRQRSFAGISKLRDLPSQKFDHVLMSGATLGKVGRTTAEEYVTSEAAVRAEVENGDGKIVLYGMRKTLYYKVEDRWEKKTDPKGGLTADMVVALFDLLRCQTARDAVQCLEKLGLQKPYDLLHLVRTIAKWSVVSFEKQEAQDDEDLVTRAHGKVRCLMCRAWMTAAAREHVYCALVEEGVLDFTQPKAKQMPKNRASGKRQPESFVPMASKAKPAPSVYPEGSEEPSTPERRPGNTVDDHVSVAEPAGSEERPGELPRASGWRNSNKLSPAERGLALRRMYGDASRGNGS